MTDWLPALGIVLGIVALCVFVAWGESLDDVETVARENKEAQ